MHVWAICLKLKGAVNFQVQVKILEVWLLLLGKNNKIKKKITWIVKCHCFGENPSSDWLVQCIIWVLHTISQDNWTVYLSACESGFVNIWEVPDGGLTEIINTPSVVLKGWLKVFGCNTTYKISFFKKSYNLFVTVRLLEAGHLEKINQSGCYLRTKDSNFFR